MFCICIKTLAETVNLSNYCSVCMFSVCLGQRLWFLDTAEVCEHVHACVFGQVVCVFVLLCIESIGVFGELGSIQSEVI